MTQPITLQLPEELVTVARAEAERSSRPLEIVLLDWIRRGGQDDLELLSDAELLDVCDGMMADDLQSRLSELQAKNREQSLSSTEQTTLNDLMDRYQRGLLRKAKAWKMAVGRGLRATASCQ